MARTGRQADELFASTKPRAKSSAKKEAPAGDHKAGRGRPVNVRGATSPATVVLYNAQIVALDGISNQVRERSGKVIKRADLIRGILAAVLAAGVDLAGATSEEEIRAAVAAQLKGK